MPSFDKLKFTSNGLNLQAGAQAGNELVFSKIKLGKGNTSGDVNSMTDLVKPVLEANIITGTLANNSYTVQANITNNGLGEGFYWTEIGLYAKDGKGNDVLYAYSSTTEGTDYIPAMSESAYMKRVKIAIVVANATNITFVKDGETYIDTLTFNEQIDSIKASLSDINSRLEDCATTDDLDKVRQDLTEEIGEVSKTLENLEKEVGEQLASIRDNYATTTSVNEKEETLGRQISEVSTAVTDLSTETKESVKTINNDISNIKSGIGSNSIAEIGDGTVKGAIAELYRLINAIPAITSGTSEPSGGEDGDVYILYE